VKIFFIKIVFYRASPIDFTWVVYKPILEDNLLNDKNKPIYKYILDTEAPFSVEPKHGVLERNMSKYFEITFSPAHVSALSISYCYN
jgi:hypothetical protein